MHGYDPRPPWARKGFNSKIYSSITNEINYQVAQMRKQGFEPSLVRLGPAASVVYAHEQWAPWGRIEEGPTEHKGYRCTVPIRYRDTSISGVVVEGKPR